MTRYGDGKATTIDAIAKAILGSAISVGTQPWAVAVTPDGTRVLVTNSGSNTVSVIDASSNTVLQNVSISNTPTGVAITPNGAQAWVTRNGTTLVSILDLGLQPGGSAAEQVPRAPMQQFPVPPGTAAADCAALAPDSVDWPGIASQHAAAWGLSYAEWPNDHSGGWVCSRQPYWIGPGWAVR